MHYKQLQSDDKAVSPVVGVILMVAVTVILAAVIGGFVLGLGGSQEESPQTSLKFQKVGTDVEVSHLSGDPLKIGEVEILIDGTRYGLPADMTAGDRVSVNDVTGSTSVPSGTEIQFVWTSGKTGKSSVLSSYTSD